MHNRIRQLRKQHGITVKQLGSIIGVSESAIYQYETGKRQPCIDILVKICDCFGVTVDYLVNGKEWKPPADPSKGPATDEQAAFLEILNRLFPENPNKP